MEENKNLTPENDENENQAEEVVKEEALEEEVIEVEEASEEVLEETEIEEEETKQAIENSEEAEIEGAPCCEKKCKKGIIPLIVGAAIVVLAIVAVIFSFFGGGNQRGTSNTGIADILKNNLYYTNYENKLAVANLKNGETKVITEDYAVHVAGYKGDIYYQSFNVAEDGVTTVYEFRKFVDGVNDVAIVSDAMSDIKIIDGYVYYLKSIPEYYSGYASRLYRAPLKEGQTPEVVCDVLCASYDVKDGMIYYCDVETTTLMKADLKKTISYIKENPLSEGGKRSSSELGAEPLIETITINPTAYKGSVYYVDGVENYELKSYDLKTGEVKSFNMGVFANTFNIYGEYIYYYNLEDYSFYRMKLDGSDVSKITGINYFGYNAIIKDKFICAEYDEQTYIPYLSVCDLDGNVITEVPLADENLIYDDAAITETEEETQTEETQIEE